MNKENHNGHFFNGFLLGILVGAAAVFLLGTKSGKNILKVLSEEGLDGLKDIINQYNDNSMEEEFEDESPEVVKELKKDAVKEAKEKADETREKVEEKIEEIKEEARGRIEEVKSEIKEPKPKRRLFKRFIS